VVIKGTSCAGARRLAMHLTRTDTNERAEVREMSGVAAEDLRGALLEMEAVAAGTRTTKPFYHASINTRADEKLTDEQRLYAIDKLEKKLGLTDQPRVVVVHEKEGREHCHIVWSRIDLDRMAAISDSHNYRKHEEVARELERAFGHERVQGAHVERDGKDRPGRTPSHAEMLAAERGAFSADEAKAQVTDLWRRTDSGQSFKAALEENDWLLARGDRRDFVVIDPNGGTHSLARRVDGAKAKDIRERMSDIDPQSLPSVAEAHAIQRQRQAEPEPTPTPEPNRSSVPPRANEVVRVSSEADRNRAVYEQLDKALQAEVRKLRDPVQSPVERKFAEGARAAAQDIRQERREEKFWDDQQRWQAQTKARAPDRPRSAARGLQVIDGATGAVSGLGDFVVGLLAGPSAPARETPADMSAFVNDPAARRKQQLARLAAKRQDENEWRALERMREDMQAGRNLKAEDVRLLTREHQQQILTFGDSAVRQMVEDARKYGDRYWKGEERERD
jgi:hypothetical protein